MGGVHKQARGIRWTGAIDGGGALDPNQILSSPSELVKQSPAKMVRVHTCGERRFYAKHYLHTFHPLRPYKFWFKRSQARLEWDLAQELLALGVPIVDHFALGERWGRGGLLESILITEAFPGTILSETDQWDRAALLAFVNRLHELGVMQRDLHPANLLVDAEGHFALVDLDGVVVKRHLSAEERRDNLAFIDFRVDLPVDDTVKARSAVLRRALLKQRARRCLKRNRDFDFRVFGGQRWQLRLAEFAEAQPEWLTHPDQAFGADGTFLKQGRTSTVARAGAVVLKRYNLKKRSNLIKDLFRRSRARRSFLMAYHLELVGIPTAKPIGVLDCRKWGLLYRSYFAMEFLRGAEALHVAAWPRLKLIRAVAQLVGRCHREGFFHRDLKLTNVLVHPERGVFLIDLDGLSFADTVSQDRAMADLDRMDRHAKKLMGTGNRDRLVFLKHYVLARGARVADWLEAYAASGETQSSGQRSRR